MANARSSKYDIDRAKRERAALKRERRQHQTDGESFDSTAVESLASADAPMTEHDVLDALELLHTRFATGNVAFDEFEACKTDLLSRLSDQ
jgi:hypothetical protein